MAINHQLYMQRCMQLATNGAGYVSPNPLVGSVIVHDDVIIGEGWHQYHGGPHAEVNAINSVKQQYRHLLTSSTLYVNLEPCAHHGKTPPCAELIVATQIPKVVIANTDPNPLVSGKGIEKLRAAGVEVIEGINEQDGNELNKRFFTNQLHQRPYVVLKWAQSADGYFTKDTNSQHWITGDTARKLSHKWRSEEDAILIGSGTAMADNPRLDIRLWPGSKAPIRVIIDRYNRVPADYHVKDGSIPTIIITNQPMPNSQNLLFLPYPTGETPTALLKLLYQHGIRSVMIEGGATILEWFVKHNTWDEARVFIGEPFFSEGIKAPILGKQPIHSTNVGNDKLYLFNNH